MFVHFPIRSYEDSGGTVLLFSVTFLDSQHNFQIINFLKVALRLKALLKVSELRSLWAKLIGHPQRDSVGFMFIG